MVNLIMNMVKDDVIMWRCGQLLSRDFMEYKMKPSVRAYDFRLDFGF